MARAHEAPALRETRSTADALGQGSGLDSARAATTPSGEPGTRARPVAELLARSGELATADVSAREAMRWGLDLVCSHLGWPFGRVLTLDASARELVSTGILHDEDPERHRPFVEAFGTARLSQDAGLPGAVVTGGRAIATDIMDPRINPAGREIGAACRLTFAVGLPILSDRGVEGVIEAMGPRRVEIDDELLALFTHVGIHVGRVVERDRARRLLRDAERLAELGPWSWDVERDELHCSPELFAMHGAEARLELDGEARLDPVARADFLAILPESERKALRAFSSRILATGRSDELEYHVKRGRATRWLRLHATVAERRDGAVVRVAGYVQDVTAHRRIDERRRRAQMELAREQRVLERIARGEPLQQTLIGLCLHIERQFPGTLCSVLLLDRTAAVLRHGAAPSMPESFVRAVGDVPVGDGMGACGTAAARGVMVIVEDIEADPLMRAYVDVAREFHLGSVWSVALTRTSGEVLGTFAVYRMLTGRPSRAEIRDLRAVGNLASLAIERSRAEAALLAAANVDPLTGLPNRTRFLELVDQRLARGDARVAVMMLEVDRFRMINDSLGHLAGERILVDVADRLRLAVGDDGTVARFGGNEFTVLVHVVTERAIAELPDRVLRALDSPISLDGGEFFLTASVGIALSDGVEADRSGAGRTATPGALELVHDADAAMAAARSRGPGSHQMYDRRLRARTIERLNREIELRRGIERGELVMHYQPVLDLRERRWCQVEALARWRHPTRGLLGPDEFIPLAEETGLIIPLGLTVLEQVIAQAAAWAHVLPGIRLAANASALQLADPGIATELIGMLDRVSVPPQQLLLEVTESALVEELDTTRASLGRLVATGVQILIDDFGTGYSSLARLGELPIAGLKVDRRFTEGLGVKPGRRRVLRAIADLARAYGLHVVAEGIEDARALADIETLGCRFAQGFHLGRPAPAEVIERLLTRPLAFACL